MNDGYKIHLKNVMKGESIYRGRNGFRYQAINVFISAVQPDVLNTGC